MLTLRAIRLSIPSCEATYGSLLRPLVPALPKQYDSGNPRSGVWQTFAFAVTLEEEALVSY